MVFKLWCHVILFLTWMKALYCRRNFSISNMALSIQPVAEIMPPPKSAKLLTSSD